MSAGILWLVVTPRHKSSAPQVGGCFPGKLLTCFLLKKKSAPHLALMLIGGIFYTFHVSVVRANEKEQLS